MENANAFGTITLHRCGYDAEITIKLKKNIRGNDTAILSSPGHEIQGMLKAAEKAFMDDVYGEDD